MAERKPLKIRIENRDSGLGIAYLRAFAKRGEVFETVRRSITELCNSGFLRVPGSTFTLHYLEYRDHADDYIVILNEDQAGELFINSYEVLIRATISLNRE